MGMRDYSHHMPVVITEGQVTPWLWGRLVHQLNNHAQAVVNFEGFAATLSLRLLWLLKSFPLRSRKCFVSHNTCKWD